MAELVTFLQSSMQIDWPKESIPEWWSGHSWEILCNDRAKVKETILAYLGPMLASGKIRAPGIDNNSGEVVWIPSEAWRIRVRTNHNFTTNFEMALNGQDIFVLGLFGLQRHCLPLLTVVDVLKISGYPGIPVPISVEPLEITRPPALSKPTVVAEQPPRHAGGRKPRHDWDAFWIEVARYADINDLNKEHRTELQKRMEQWTSEQWAEPPDSTTIRKKLKALYARAAAPN